MWFWFCIYILALLATASHDVDHTLFLTNGIQLKISPPGKIAKVMSSTLASTKRRVCFIETGFILQSETHKSKIRV